MSKILKYPIQEFNAITFNGFNLSLPEATIKLISELSLQVGSPGYVKTPIFQKRENPLKQTTQPVIDKRRKGKNVEINDEDWSTIRNFQTTKFATKEGITVQIDIIRSHLNKMSDKNYIDSRNKIVDEIDKILNEHSDTSDLNQVSLIIFEIASTNRFFSKIYADLYSDLFLKYEFMRSVFENSFDTFLQLFNTIEYVVPEEDYDKFCKINKDNEKRKSLSVFFVNLMINGIIDKVKIVHLLKMLLLQLSEFSVIPNKRNEVDELIENVALLYKKELFECDSKDENLLIDGLTITGFITKIAKTKVQKDMSLSNKTIFKCMDLIGM
jgi:hypothetical protein